MPNPRNLSPEMSRLARPVAAIEGDWLANSLPRALHVYKRVNAHVVMPLAYEIAAHSATLDVI
ncbi:hypothetical protein N9N27_02295 [Planktomarina sp.]|nr:hypothetical protein [Planktomarina sp.]